MYVTNNQDSFLIELEYALVQPQLPALTPDLLHKLQRQWSDYVLKRSRQLLSSRRYETSLTECFSAWRGFFAQGSWTLCIFEGRRLSVRL